MGNWYEIYHSSKEPFQPDSWTCVQAQYTDLDAETGSFNVYNSSQGKLHGPRFGLKGNAYCPSDTSQYGEGQCYVRFFNQEWESEPNYLVIDSDYDNYAIVYTCGEDDMQYLWFMAREPTLSDELYDSMLATTKLAVPHYDFTKFTKDD